MKNFVLISTIVLILLNLNLYSQDDYYDDDDWEPEYALNSASLFGQYSMFIGDLGAQYNGGLSVGASYEYRVTRDIGVGGLLEFQRWSDVRNASASQIGGVGQTPQNAPRNYLGNNKVGLIFKGYIPTDGSYDIFAGGILSYNFVNYINDIPIGGTTGQTGGTQRGNYQRFRNPDNSVGIDVIGGVRYGFYEDIKLDMSLRIGWLGLSGGSTIMFGGNLGLVYEF